MGLIMRGRKCYTGKVKGQPVLSTDEMCIGTIDINGVEKKLYQKTLVFDTIQTEEHQYNLGLNATSVMVDISHSWLLSYYNTSDTSDLVWPAQSTNGGMSNNKFQYGLFIVWISASKDIIDMYIGASMGSTIRKAYITIQYTKD